MRALIKKELTEVLVPFGIAFLVITLVWLVSVRFWDALLPPATDTLIGVAVTSALAGAVLGYLQFSAERWRGKLGYLVHRGTGVEGAFLAKAIAGLSATALVGFGPPLLYALLASFTSPNAPILQWSVLVDYASAATAGASLYGIGALAASLRRRSIAGILLIPFGACALWVISELCGTPWGNPSSAWLFPTLQLALAAMLLGLVRRLARSSVDRDVSLPRGVHLAAVLLAVPLVLLPCDFGASILKERILDAARSDNPMILRDRATEEIFLVVRGENGGHFRMEAGGRAGARVEPNAPQGPGKGFDTIFWGRGFFSSLSDPTPPADRFESSYPLLTRRGLTPIAVQYLPSLDEAAYAPNVRTHLDRKRGVIRAFGYATYGSQVRSEVGGDRSVPFELELGKPPGGALFSSETVVLQGEDGAVRRLASSRASEDPKQVRLLPILSEVLGWTTQPEVQLYCCVFDPSDQSFWRLDVLDVESPLSRVELPGGDRFVRLQSLFRRSELVFGRYQSHWEDPLVAGERGRYVWNGRELVEFLPSETLATLDEAPSLVRYRVLVDDPDPLRWTLRVLDAKDDREVFAHAYAPRTGKGSVAAAAAQASVLLRSPLANTLLFTGVVSHRTNQGFDAGSEFLAGGRRPWLWALAMIVALSCAGICARLLRRRNASPIGIALGSVFGLLFGLVGLLVVWLLEPKGGPREIPAVRAVPEPALVIQSV